MKYTIELEDIGNGLYKAKGFNTLVFDQNGIDKLEPVEATKVTDEFPQIGDEYFCICGDGHVFKTKVIDDDLDANRMAIGNVFRTQEEAKFGRQCFLLLYRHIMRCKIWISTKLHCSEF